MSNLNGTLISLRALEKEDIDFLYQTENDTHFWEVSDTRRPFSKYILKRYLENSHQDIFEAKQLRLVIEDLQSGKPAGLIDLFDYHPQHMRAGIGILILPEHQKKGFALEALKILSAYAFEHIGLHQIYAHVPEENAASIALFEKSGFEKTGILKDWVRHGNDFKNIIIYQLLNNL